MQGTPETTNAAGRDLIAAPGHGDYRLRVLSDFGFTPFALTTGYTDVFSIASTTVSDPTFDAGLIPS